jgi:hypothetical protein
VVAALFRAAIDARVIFWLNGKSEFNKREINLVYRSGY